MAKEVKRTKPVTVALNIPVDRQLLRDLLCTAVEGGSNYWAEFREAERTQDLDYVRVRVIENTRHAAGIPRVNRNILAEDLATGLEALARAASDPAQQQSFPAAAKHLADALGENGDALTADCVLQMTVFGEVIYG